VARAYPRRQLYPVLDNYGTHTHPTVAAWLSKHPRIHLGPVQRISDISARDLKY
jgi:hypothetical protein